jgi:hypothetical protein
MNTLSAIGTAVTGMLGLAVGHGITLKRTALIFEPIF